MIAEQHRLPMPSSFGLPSIEAMAHRLRQRPKLIAVGLATALVLFVGIAIAIGGGSSPAKTAGVNNGALPRTAISLMPTLHKGAPVAVAPVPAPSAESGLSLAGATPTDALGSGTAGAAAGTGSVPQSAARSAVTNAAGVANAPATNTTGSSAAATRIVKTGTLQLRVAKGQVGSTVSKLTDIAGREGGYVSSSETDSGSFPDGQITLRVPVAGFAATVSAAQALGHVVQLSTQARDVTGQYVDLNAREHALERTRSTYLTILSRATTIGATLAVQQRIDDVQQQIDELHGQIKVLGNQSAYSTLTVYVSQAGTPKAAVRHHPSSGLGNAWHTSWHRFNRGFDAIVGAIGPLVLALILLGLVVVVLRLIYRATQRGTGTRSAGSAGQ
jgi:hypothetical protein